MSLPCLNYATNLILQDILLLSAGCQNVNAGDGSSSYRL